MNERKHTAFHEAGHAVAALELDVQFDGISIVPTDHRAGRVGVEDDDGFPIHPGTDWKSPDNERAFRAWAARQAIIDYAGHAAVVVLLRVGDMSYRSAAQHGAWDDYDKASARLGRNHRRITAARERAVEIVSAREADVRKIAMALIKHGGFDSQNVDMLLAWGTLELPSKEVIARKMRSAKR